MKQNSRWKLLLTPMLLTAFAGTALAVEDNREGISVFAETKTVTKKKKKKSKHEFNGYAESGLGYDSNPYLTPSSPYYDFSADANESSPTFEATLSASDSSTAA